MFALNLNIDNRILSACIVLPSTPETMPRVDTLPDGDINNYLYVDGNYVYDPIPEPEIYELASRRYDVGELIEGQGEMLEAISIIPAGAKLIPNHNIRKITLEEYIKKTKEATK